MTPPVRFRPEAEAEIREAFLWYQEQAPGLGYDFLRAVNLLWHPLSEPPGLIRPSTSLYAGLSSGGFRMDSFT